MLKTTENNDERNQRKAKEMGEKCYVHRQEVSTS